MTSVVARCRDCDRPRKPGAIFCECGALLDYSAPNGALPVEAPPAPNGDVATPARTGDAATPPRTGDAATPARTGDAATPAPTGDAATPAPTGDAATQASDGDAKDHEWPPQSPYARTTKPRARTPVSMPVVPCVHCKALNPETFVLCWKCEKPIHFKEEAAPPSRLRKALHLETPPPLPAGERTRPRKAFFGTDARTLARIGLILAAVLLVVAALAIGAAKAWGPAWSHTAHAYGVSREALFPRFHPVHPSSVRPPRTKLIDIKKRVPVITKGRQVTVIKNGKKTKKTKVITIKGDNPHPAADAFDRNLSTYWQSLTKREVPDLIRVYFKRAAKEIDEVAIFAGDPTATTIVPRTIQMTFYHWEPHPSELPGECAGQFPPHFPAHIPFDHFCVTGIAKQFQLLNTPTEQRFSTGNQRDVAQVVITIRGTHRSDNKKAKAALTDIEFFDKR